MHGLLKIFGSESFDFISCLIKDMAYKKKQLSLLRNGGDEILKEVYRIPQNKKKPAKSLKLPIFHAFFHFLKNRKHGMFNTKFMTVVEKVVMRSCFTGFHVSKSCCKLSIKGFQKFQPAKVSAHFSGSRLKMETS